MVWNPSLLSFKTYNRTMQICNIEFFPRNGSTSIHTNNDIYKRECMIVRLSVCPCFTLHVLRPMDVDFCVGTVRDWLRSSVGYFSTRNSTPKEWLTHWITLGLLVNFDTKIFENIRRFIGCVSDTEEINKNIYHLSVL